MKKILAVLGSLFIATSGYAWTPTVEVVRDSSNVLMRVGGWPTVQQMNEIDWSTFSVNMVIGGQGFDVTAAVISLFTSGHPSVTFAFNGHFDLNIALNQYFGMDPRGYPVALRVCKFAQYGSECGDSIQDSLVKRKPQDPTADTIGYPSPLLAACSNLPGGRTDMEPHTAWTQYVGPGAGHYGVTGTEVYLDKTTVITGFKAVVTNAASNGVATIQAGNPVLSIYSSVAGMVTSPLQADIVDRAPMSFIGNGVTIGNYCVGIFNNYNSIYSEVRLQTPLTLAPGYYVFSPRFEGGGLYFTNSMVDLGTDYATGYSNPGLLYILNQTFLGQTGTSAFNILGY